MKVRDILRRLVGRREPVDEYNHEHPCWGFEVCDMVRTRLENHGVEMEGCPPMNYDDAISVLWRRTVRRCAKIAKERSPAAAEAILAIFKDDSTESFKAFGARENDAA